MGGGDLNLKKSWHPHTMKNQERVWKAEQAKQEEQRKLDDLRKEINEERDREELRRIGENSGVLAGNHGGEAKLEWMYKNSAELINREEYLLGRKIDKSFEQLQAEERRTEHSALGLKQSINHVEHECVPFSIREYRNLQSTEQVDMQRKTMEDPLMLIKQREMESRRKLLENPVKLKEIHRILKTEQEQAAKRNKKSKKSKKSKKKKHKNGSSSDDSDNSNDDLDRKLAKQMKKLKGESTNGDFKLDKLLDAKYRTLTKQLDMATKPKKQNKKSRMRSDSESSEESSEEEQRKKTKESRDKRDGESRDTRRRRDRSNSSADGHTKRRERERDQDVRRQQESSKSRRWHSRSRSPRRDQQSQRQRSRTPRRDQQQRKRSRSADKQRTQRRERSRERSRDRRFRRSCTPVKQHQQRRNPSPPPAQRTTKPKLSEAEREARLREMMDNATWREADRTKVVKKHREEYAREEAQNQARGFDKQFINKEVKKAIDNQTSIGNRIRSNLNNIQRTSSAMDSNFARK